MLKTVARNSGGFTFWSSPGVGWSVKIKAPGRASRNDSSRALLLVVSGWSPRSSRMIGAWPRSDLLGAVSAVSILRAHRRRVAARLERDRHRRAHRAVLLGTAAGQVLLHFFHDHRPRSRRGPVGPGRAGGRGSAGVPPASVVITATRPLPNVRAR